MGDARRASVRAATIAAVAWCATSLLPAAPAAAQAQQETTWDFETGNLRGWRATGNAFRFQPIRGDNVAARGRGQTSNHVGQWWVGTFEHNEGPGAFQGDEPTGTLTSGLFTIPDSITFLIGGGSSFETRVEFIVQDPIEGGIRAAFASGRDVETMRRQVWDTRQWAGQSGRIRIVDESSGPWGHINVDDFRFHAGPAVFEMVPGFEIARPPAPVGVPSLIGRHIEEAEGLLGQFRLRLGTVRRASAEARPGTVLAQEPAPGAQVQPGTAVNVTVSAWVEVPDLVRRDTLAAWEILARVGLRRGRVLREESEAPSGTVLRQTPGPGEPSPPGAQVGVTVAIPMTTTVPPLRELDLERAADLLRRAFLPVGRVEERLSEQPLGTVLDQDPPAGARVPRGTPVALAVARGVPVPDVRGGDQAAAATRLEAARLALGDVGGEPSPEPMGTVLAQSPPPGTEAPLGSGVAILVAQGVPVPDLVGAAGAAAAGRLLGERSLTLGRVVELRSAEPLGTVLDQDPGAGDVVPLRTVVDVVVATGVAVPGLIGRQLGAARTALEGADLAEGSMVQEVSSSPPGTVLRQTPAAGTLVPLGTPVAMVVALGVEVPSVTSLDSVGAADALTSVGLVPGPVTRRWDGADPGTVVTQTPPAGDVVAAATEVSLVLSSWPSVPDLTSLDSAAARAALADSGLVLSVGDRPWTWRRAIEVLGQDRIPGTPAAPSTPVVVDLARPIPVVPLGAGLLVLVAVGSIVRVQKRPSRKRRRPRLGGQATQDDVGRQDPDSGEAPDAPLRVVPHIDAGRARFTSPPPRSTLEVRLRPTLDGGRQTVVGGEPAVASETVRPGAGPGRAGPAPDPNQAEERDHG